MASPVDLALEIISNSYPVTETGCWIWIGSCMRNGYGQTKSSVAGRTGKTRLAHRISYKAFFSDPGSLCVLHKCDVRECVNPSHLYLGTYSDNTRDCRFRHRLGGGRPAILNSQQESEIKLRYDSGDHRVKKIAIEYGVAWRTVYDILKRLRR